MEGRIRLGSGRSFWRTADVVASKRTDGCDGKTLQMNGLDAKAAEEQWNREQAWAAGMEHR
jgi:hypothetical protein